MESAPTILWKYIYFFGGSKPPPYILKLNSPLKLQSRGAIFLFWLMKNKYHTVMLFLDGISLLNKGFILFLVNLIAKIVNY